MLKKKEKQHIVTNEKAITLIALVVTIVILLILAGVTITMTLGQNGLFIKTQQAKKAMKDAADKEREQLNQITDEMKIGEKSDKNDSPFGVKTNGYEWGSWTNKDIIITMSGKTDDEKYQYSLDNNTWNDCGDSITIDKDQVQTYYFRIVDNANNVKFKTDGKLVEKDTTKPSMAFCAGMAKSKDNIWWTTKDISDSGSGLEQENKVTISHKILDESDDKYVVDYEGTDSTGTIKELTYNLTYIIKATVEDKAGNKIEAKEEVLYSTDRVKFPKLTIEYGWNYSLVEDISDEYTEEVKNDMKNSTLDVIVNKYCTDSEIIEKCEGKTIMNPVYHIEKLNDNNRNSSGMYVIEYCWPHMTDDMTGITLLYYDLEEKKILELVEPLDIDKENKCIKFELKKVNGIIIPMCDDLSSYMLENKN